MPDSTISRDDVVLCHPVRTAIGIFGGTLKGTAATDLGVTEGPAPAA